MKFDDLYCKNCGTHLANFSDEEFYTIEVEPGYHVCKDCAGYFNEGLGFLDEIDDEEDDDVFNS